MIRRWRSLVPRLPGGRRAGVWASVGSILVTDRAYGIDLIAG